MRGMATRKLSSVNLNQLLALDTLLAEGSVTRAAKQIGVSQSALSHSLSGLRGLFGDPLLVRSRDGMVLSERAERLSGPLRRALLDLEHALEDDSSFDPLTSRREFRLATADFIAVRVATQLAPKIAKVAPNFRLTFRPIGMHSLLESLERGDIDAVIGPPLDHAKSIEQEPWRDEEFVCVVRGEPPHRDHQFDLETYAKLDHVLISPTGGGAGWVDEALAKHGLSRRVIFRVPSFLMAPLIVANSDLVLTAPLSSVAPFIQAHGFRRVAIPIEIAPLSLSLIWLRRHSEDPGHKWFRELLASTG